MPTIAAHAATTARSCTRPTYRSPLLRTIETMASISATGGNALILWSGASSTYATARCPSRARLAEGGRATCPPKLCGRAKLTTSRQRRTATRAPRAPRPPCRRVRRAERAPGAREGGDALSHHQTATTTTNTTTTRASTAGRVRLRTVERPSEIRRSPPWRERRRRGGTRPPSAGEGSRCERCGCEDEGERKAQSQRAHASG